jgi:hypothetical protein
MSRFELIAYAIVTACVVLWYAVSNRAAILKAIKPSPPASSEADWMKGWVATLLDLKDALEAEGMEDSVVLVRELLWRMLGGHPHDISAKGDKR